MGRMFFGSLLFGWGSLVIGANSGGDPYATTGDLYFGFILVAVGVYLAGTGIYRARSMGSPVQPVPAQGIDPTGAARVHRQQKAPAGVTSSPNIGREIFVGLFVSVVSALILKVLST